MKSSHDGLFDYCQDSHRVFLQTPGALGGFGDTSVQAASADAGKLSIFAASRRFAQPLL